MESVECGHEESIADAYAWCMECGAPLGLLEAECVSGFAKLDSVGAVPVRIQMRNVGKGRLWAGLGPQQEAALTLPAGLTCFDLMPGKQREFELDLDPVALTQGLSSLYVNLWALDGPRRAEEGPLEAKRKPEIPIRLRWVERRPLLHAERLLARPRRPNPVLRIYNPGNVEEEIVLRAVGCEIIAEAGRRGAELPMTVPENDSVTVTVSAPPGFQNASITVTSQSESRVVEVREIRPMLPDAPDHPYTAGIDFGTSKSAVFFTPHWSQVERTVPVLWDDPREAGKKTWFVPSALSYPADRTQKTKFGWNITGTDAMAVRDMKTKLRLGKPISLPGRGEIDAEVVVEDFLGHIWRQTLDSIGRDSKQENGAAIRPTDILVALAMPVGETKEARAEQRQRTEAAAQAAFPLNVQIKMALEPECAAADFLLRGAEWGFVPADGHKACIFDCGAGTTDISVIQVSYSGSRPTFEVLCQSGYEFGGNVIDRLLTEELIEQGKIVGVVKPAVEPGKFITTVIGANGVKIETQENNALSLTDLCEYVKSVKENLRFPVSADETPVALPVGDLAGLEITWDLVNSVVKPVMQAMLTGGGKAPAGMGGIPLKTALDENGIGLHEIDWLCITGGSALIPAIVDELERFFGATLVPPREKLAAISRDSERPLTLNVARGAASILQVQTPTLLGFDVAMRLESGGETMQRPEGLSRGASPGSPPCPVRPLTLQSNREGTLYVTAQFPGEAEPKVIHVERLAAAPDGGKRLFPLFAFTETEQVTLKLDADPILVA